MSKTLCGERIFLVGPDQEYELYCKDFPDHDGDHYGFLNWQVSNA